MQLNVERLSAAKRHIIVTGRDSSHWRHLPSGDTRQCRQVRPPHNLRFRHYQLHTPCQTWTCDMFAATSMMLHVCRRLRAAMSFVWADITLPTSTNHQLNTGTTQICHQSFLILQSWLETFSTTVSRSQPGSSVVLGDFPHSQHRPSVIHIGLQLPIIRGVQRRRWNFRKADWASYTLATERSISLIPVNNISVEESYQRFCGVMQKAARHSIPRGFRPTYTPYLDD